jgi:hypothetical protein
VGVAGNSTLGTASVDLSPPSRGWSTAVQAVGIPDSAASDTGQASMRGWEGVTAKDIAAKQLAKAKPSKYRNRKTTVDGLLFDSAKEAKRWQELVIMCRAGLIANLERQTVLRIFVKDVKVCDYQADFTYLEQGQLVVEDVKSPATRKKESYVLKRKLVEAYYQLTIRET